MGGGIIEVGIGVGLLRQSPGLRVKVLEAESVLAVHGSSRISGVLHAFFSAHPTLSRQSRPDLATRC